MKGSELMQTALEAYRGIVPEFIELDDREQFVEYLNLVYLIGKPAFEILIEDAKYYERLKNNKNEC